MKQSKQDFRNRLKDAQVSVDLVRAEDLVKKLRVAAAEQVQDQRGFGERTQG